MTTLSAEHWFTEIAPGVGSAFSLQIKGKLHEEQTLYQRIAIYDTEDFGHLMVIDGCTMLSARENFLYHEMLVHPALFTHPCPRRVGIIGGGDCGTLREVLKHPQVETAVQIDIDERVTRLAERYFPELTASNADPRAQLLFEDGVRWIDTAAPASLEVLIIDSTDPVGPAAGLFSRDFHRACRRVLAPGGILVQQSESPLYHTDLIRALHAELRAAEFRDVRVLCFPQPIYPSGWWSATLARVDGTFDDWRQADAAARPFATRYYNADLHRAALAPPQFLCEALTQAA